MTWDEVRAIGIGGLVVITEDWNGGCGPLVGFEPPIIGRIFTIGAVVDVLYVGSESDGCECMPHELRVPTAEELLEVS